MNVKYENENESSEDISGRVISIIWMCLLAFGLGLFVIIWGLINYFQWQLEAERYKKVALIKSSELADLRRYEERVLGGQIKILEDRKNASISSAMNKMLARD